MIFSGLDWGTMLAALEDIVGELERTAGELRSIVERHRAIELEPPALCAVVELRRHELGTVAGLEAVSEPIPGRAGWRRDRIGREWYSDAWLDGPGAA